MSKIKLVIECESEQEAEMYLKGPLYYSQLEEMYDEMIRPYFKHGFPNPKLNALIEDNHEAFGELFDHLVEIYGDIRRQE